MDVSEILNLLKVSSSTLDGTDKDSLVIYLNRLKLWPVIVRRYLEEEILGLVTISLIGLMNSVRSL